MPGLLDDKKLLITGVLTEASIAFGVARLAQEQGATVLLSGFGRGLSITQRIASRLPQPADVVELDITDTAHLDGLAARACTGNDAHGATRDAERFREELDHGRVRLAVDGRCRHRDLEAAVVDRAELGA